MENKVTEYSEKIFENIKHLDEYGNEYWEARELQLVLEYKEWRFFQKIVEKAQIACLSSNNNVSDHFGVYSKIVEIGASEGVFRKILDYHLSRYACYLIVQNGNPKNKTIALGQTYFAIQTRKQELSEDEYKLLNEDEKRLYRRKQTRGKNLMLYEVASIAGVKNFDKFTNAGYRGLYNGESADDIFKRKNLRYREDILDNMCSDELIANEFRISQTEQKLKNENIKGEDNATRAHHKVGRIVRESITKIGGTMPEDFPTPSKSLKELEKLKKAKN